MLEAEQSPVTATEPGGGGKEGHRGPSLPTSSLDSVPAAVSFLCFSLCEKNKTLIV